MAPLRRLLAVLFCCAVSTAAEGQALQRSSVAAELRPTPTSSLAPARPDSLAFVRAELRRAAADDSLTDYRWTKFALVGAVVGGVASAALVASNSTLPGCGDSGSSGFCTGARILVVGAGVGVGAFGGWLVARLTR
jgi:hypothetical protein